jgi:hypothetical protein
MKRKTKMLRSRFTLAMFLLLTLLAGSTFSARSALPEQGLLSGSTDQKLTKVSHDLLVLYQEYQAYLIQGSGGALKPSNAVLPVINDRVVVDATASGDTGTLLTDLEALGLQKAASYGRMVSGQLPIDAIDDLDALDSLNFVRPAYATTSVGLVDSQGDAAMNADDARTTWGVDGTGVTVGTLSDSYDCAPAPITDAATDVANGDLPAGVTVLDDTACPGTDEGRAMMQIIADVAPGANQAFHTAFNGQADFAQGIEDLATAGAEVIVDDIGYFAEPFFQDGIVAQAVDNVVGMGVAYFSSAGNSGRRSYESPFVSSGTAAVDPSGDAHDFDPGPGIDVFQSVTIPEGATVSLSFQWDQPFFAVSGAPGSASDLDIYLVDEPPTTVLVSSAGRNVGGDPLEILNFTNPGPATTFNIVIEKYLPAGGSDPDLIKYVDFRGVIIVNEYATDSSTVVGHANADGAVAVGAAPYYSTPEFGTDPAVLESFSSAGGTPILFATDGTRLSSSEYRPKPLIVAPDAGNTTFFGNDISDPGDGSDADTFPNFFGTSAAAPHAAAVAALLLEARASLTPAQVSTLLKDTALDMDGSDVPGFPDGFDNDSGHGLIDADAALTQLDEGYSVFLPIVLNSYDASELLRNGNFGTGAWTPWQTIESPALDDQVYHSASYSARLIGRNNVDSDYVAQEVTVPSNATQVTLDFWYRVSGNDSSSPADFMCVEILDSGFSTVLVPIFCYDLYTQPQNQWLNFQSVISGADLTPLLGQTVFVSFQGWTNATNPGTAWVDDVSFKVTATGP